MRSFLSVAVSLFLASSVGFGSLSTFASASALQQRSDSQCLGEICPSLSSVSKRDDCVSELECTKAAGVTPTSTSDVDSRSIDSRSTRRDLTNAQRLARGLRLKAPARRSSARRNTYAARAQSSPVPQVTYTGVIQVFSGDTSLGYVAPDPNYWTPLLTPDINSALKVSFQLDQGATSGSQLALSENNDGRGPLFGPVVGRDSSSSNIASGSFNYLYFDPTSSLGTAPGSPPQSIPSYFSTSSGLNKQAETSVWSVNLVTKALSLQWINTDGSTPSTIAFVQSNHLYAGGDPNAFQSRFPSPVSTVTLKFIVA